MNELPHLPRSPQLMSRDDTALLVVDLQERLLPAIAERDRLVWNVRRLLDAAQLFDVPVAATEQYPKGLGPTVTQLQDRLPAAACKQRFSCGGCPQIFSAWTDHGVRKILIVGIETHVCVLQSTLDLLTAGFDVFVAADAVGSRHELDQQLGLRRMEMAGAYLTTTETAMFEWCEDSRSDAFRALSQLVRETAPASSA